VLVFSHGKLSELSYNEGMLTELRRRRELFQPTQPVPDRPEIMRSY